MSKLRNLPALSATIDSFIALGLAVGAVVWVNQLEARHARGPVGAILLSFLIGAFLYEACRVLGCNKHAGWHSREPERIIILGSGRRASKAWRELRVRNHRTKSLIGFVDDRDPAAMPPDIASRLLGTVEDLPDYLLRNVVDELLVAAPIRSCYDLSQRAVSMAEAAGIRVVCLNDVFTLTPEKSFRRPATVLVELVPRNRKRRNAEQETGILDVLGAAAGIVLLAPVFLGIGLAIKLSGPGSIFFEQERHSYLRRLRMLRSMVR